MDRTELLEKTKKEVRSLLISAPRGVPARLLLSDYKMVTGKELPYRQLGFRSLDDLVRAIPEVVRADMGSTGQLTFFGVANANTRQIARFVQVQKKPKLKRSGMPPAISFRTPVNRTAFTSRNRYGPRSTPRPMSRSYGRPAVARHLQGRSQSLPLGGGRFPGLPPRLQQRMGYQNQPQSSRYGQQPSREPAYQPRLSSGDHQGDSWSNRMAAVKRGESDVRPPPGFQPRDGWGREERRGNSEIRPPPGFQARDRWGQEERRGDSEVRPPPGFQARDGWGREERVVSERSHGSVTMDTLPAKGYRQTPKDIPPWRNEFEKAPTLTIHELNNQRNEQKFYEVVCVLGWSGAVHKEYPGKDGKKVLKILLYESYRTKPVQPAVMLFFQPPFWNVDEYPAPLSLGEGARLRVYGGTFQQFSQKKEAMEPAITVKHYEKLSPAVKPCKRLCCDNLSPTISRPLLPTPGTSTSKGYKSHSSSNSSSTSSSHSSPRQSPMPPSSPAATPVKPKLDLKKGSLQEQVYELLLPKPTGIWGRRLSKEYEARYKATPPKDLLARAKIMPFVKWEEVVDDNPIMYVKDEYKVQSASPVTTPTVTPVTTPTAARTPSTARTSHPPESLTITVSNTSNDGRKVTAVTDLASPRSRSKNVPRLLSSPKPVSKPKAPPLPSTIEITQNDEEMVDVYVCNVTEIVSFYVQRIGEEYYDKLEEMNKKLNDHFSKSPQTASTVATNHLYGYKWCEDDEGGEEQWCRALVVSITDSQADVTFPDYGNSEQVETKDLKELPHQFYQLPFQAIHCCLHGMVEGMDTKEANEKFYELAAGLTCIANIMDSSGMRVAIELMDPEAEETMNSILLKAYHPVATLVPQLPTPGSSMVPITLTDVDDYGVVSIQLHGAGLNQLQQLMSRINETYSKKSTKRSSDFVSKPSEGMVCCAKYVEDDQWYRVKVKSLPSPESPTGPMPLSSKVFVEYVDYGNVEQLDRSKLRKALNTELFSLPFQAVKCELHGLPPTNGKWTEEVAMEVWNYIHHDDLHLEVVHPSGEGKLASVKILVKEGENVHVLNELLAAKGHLFGVPPVPASEERTEELDLSYSSISDEAFEDAVEYSDEQPLPPSATDRKEENHLPIAGEVKQNSLPVSADSEAPAVINGHRKVNTDLKEVQSRVQSMNLSVPSSSSSVNFSPRSPSGSPPSTSATFSPRTPSLSPRPSTPPFSPRSPSTPSDGGTEESFSFETLASESKMTAVYVPYVDSPHKFTVQVLSKVEELESMMSQLSRHLLPSPLSAIAPGRVCSANSSIDKRWYRVVIAEVHRQVGVVDSTAAEATVQFVDYGGTERFPCSALRELPREFLKLPFQGIAAALHGVGPPGDGDSWSHEATEFFKERVCECQFFAAALAQEPSCVRVVLLDTSGESDSVVADELVLKGFAVKAARKPSVTK